MSYFFLVFLHAHTQLQSDRAILARFMLQINERFKSLIHFRVRRRGRDGERRELQAKKSRKGRQESERQREKGRKWREEGERVTKQERKRECRGDLTVHSRP